MLEQLDIHMQKQTETKNFHSYLQSHKKINSKWIADPNINPKNIKLPEKKEKIFMIVG